MRVALNKLRSTLMDKLGIGQAQLYRRIKANADRFSLPTKEATLLLALQERINLSKYDIPPSLLDRLRPLTMPASASSSNMSVTKASSPRAGMKTIKPLEVGPMLLPSKTEAEVNEMVPTYQKLYVLENSMRQFISRVMEKAYGSNWWTGHVTSGLEKTVQSRMSDEQRNAWHQRRGKDPIDYLDLKELPAIVRVNHAQFVPRFLPDLNWFEALVDEVYKSRCVVCHMNPLETNNIKAVEVRYNHWKQLLAAKTGELS